MRPRIYLETTIASYLTARPSRDLVTAAHQQITRDWRETRRHGFELFISQIVLDEAGAGDEDALDFREEGADLADALREEVPLPESATADALHIALAVINGMDYLLTWNCTHIANAALRTRIVAVCRRRGFEVPIICTPEELMEG